MRITGRQTGGGHVLANFEYISRAWCDADQHVPLYTSEGDVLHDPRDMANLATEWQDWEMGDDARRRGATSISMILSMPGGTDPEGLRLAAIDFAREEFANRSWVAALHVDRDHPHVHLTIARRDHDGRRFHLDREDLFRYRQRFAARLRDWGIEANATPARARGVDPKHDHIAAVKMRAKGQTSQLDRSRADRAERLQREGKADPVAAVIARQQAVVVSTYHRSIEELVATGTPEARAVADSLKTFVEALPPPSSNAARAIAGRDMDGQSPATKPGPDGPIAVVLERARKMRETIKVQANRDRERPSGETGSRRLKAAIERSRASTGSAALSTSSPDQSIDPPGPSISDMLREVQERDREVRDRTRDRGGPER